MRVSFEGSAADVKELLSNADIMYAAAKADIISDESVKKLSAAKTQIEALKDKIKHDAENKLSDKEQSELISLRASTANLNAMMQQYVAEIQRLNYELKNPIRLSEKQEAEIEVLHQESIKAYDIKPLLFAHPVEKDVKISAEQMFRAVLGNLSEGKKMQAIKCLREVTGMGLMQAKKLIEGSLAFAAHEADKAA